ncbi:MAG: nitronate monooxygenase [Lachnospiraceae bacterium]|nr:nitronate monooxygenase [Lachnospiraceae bacterium]
MNRVCGILGITKPVVQAPMTWITSPELAAAVSNARGLGVLGFNAGFETGKATPEETAEEMRKVIRKTKELTDRPFGMNVMTSAFDGAGFSKATIEVCKGEGVKVLVAIGALDTEQIKEWKDAGFKVIYRDMYPTVASAKAAEEAGVDVIVATGCDEGGGMPVEATGTMVKTALMADAVSIPVLAAGGIVNEAMAKASACVGAEGAYAGTRFVLSKECRAAQATKDDILNTGADDLIVLTEADGYVKWRCTPHKVAKEAVEQNNQGNMKPSTGSFYHGMLKGDLEAGINTVSSAASLIRSIDSCEDIVNELARGYGC